MISSTLFIIIWIICGLISSVMWVVYLARNNGRVTVGDVWSTILFFLFGAGGILATIIFMVDACLGFFGVFGLIIILMTVCVTDGIIWRKKP